VPRKVITKATPAPVQASVGWERVVDKVPYTTGFCGNGYHEGTKKLSRRGTLMKACQGSFYILGKTYECMCDCHSVARQIFEITGIKRAIPSNDLIGMLYAPSSASPPVPPTGAHGTEVTPVTATTGQHTPASVGPVPGVSLLRPLLPKSPAEAFSPTDTGQRARGQLEAEVAAVMHKWFRGNTTTSAIPLTPESVRNAIKSQPSPSNGAIYSIFKRWAGKNWCVLADRPFRMVHPTEQGIRGLRRWSE
jgi:hypothetical protein